MKMAEKKKLKDGRRVNKGKDERFVHIKYEHSGVHKFTSFSKFIDK